MAIQLKHGYLSEDMTLNIDEELRRISRKARRFHARNKSSKKAVFPVTRNENNLGVVLLLS